MKPRNAIMQSKNCVPSLNEHRPPDGAHRPSGVLPFKGRSRPTFCVACRATTPRRSGRGAPGDRSLRGFGCPDTRRCGPPLAGRRDGDDELAGARDAGRRLAPRTGRHLRGIRHGLRRCGKCSRDPSRARAAPAVTRCRLAAPDREYLRDELMVPIPSSQVASPIVAVRESHRRRRRVMQEEPPGRRSGEGRPRRRTIAIPRSVDVDRTSGRSRSVGRCPRVGVPGGSGHGGEEVEPHRTDRRAMRPRSRGITAATPRSDRAWTRVRGPGGRGLCVVGFVPSHMQVDPSRLQVVPSRV
jgi:hypothetical protein